MMELWAGFCFFPISGVVYAVLVPGTSSCPALKETPAAAFAPHGPAALPWEKGKHPLAQHSWHGGVGCSAAKQKECPNIICSELNRGQWNVLVQLKWEWSSWSIFHKHSGFGCKEQMPLTDSYPIQRWQVIAKPSLLLSVALLHRVLNNPFS